MNALAIADVYRGRIRGTRDWGFMRYVIDYMTAGVALAGRTVVYLEGSFQVPRAHSDAFQVQSRKGDAAEYWKQGQAQVPHLCC